MPTTTYNAPNVAVAAIGGRTSADGVAVSDYTAEEARLITKILRPGYLTPSGAWKVAAQSTPNMTVRVGSGTAKADHYVVEGLVGGQGNYIVRLDASSVSLTVPAADASQARTDEVYLVVLDDTYDATLRGLPQLGYRKGDLGGTPPGPDGAWEAYALLASIQVPAAATSVTGGQITDGRAPAELVESLLAIDTDALVLKAIVDAKGDLLAGTAADTVDRVPVGANGRVLVADSSQATGIRWSPVVATAPVTLTDASPAVNAALGEFFRLSATADRTIAAPANPSDGQSITIEHHASGAARTLSLSTAAGGFAFGDSIPALTATASGKRDFIRAIYHSALGKWVVVGYSKGF